MKRNKLFFVTFVTCTIILLTFVNLESQADTNVITKLDNSPELAIGTVLAIYETVVRIVPTRSNNSILNAVFKFLHKVSEFLNVKKG